LTWLLWLYLTHILPNMGGCQNACLADKSEVLRLWQAAGSVLNVTMCTKVATALLFMIICFLAWTLLRNRGVKWSGLLGPQTALHKMD
jgi:hypothetical protein